MKTFIGGIGCFWDEKKYEGIKGIISTECGYCGGDEPNVRYKAVWANQAGSSKETQLHGIGINY